MPLSFPRATNISHESLNKANKVLLVTLVFTKCFGLASSNRATVSPPEFVFPEEHPAPSIYPNPPRVPPRSRGEKTTRNEHHRPHVPRVPRTILGLQDISTALWSFATLQISSVQVGDARFRVWSHCSAEHRREKRAWRGNTKYKRSIQA